MTRVFDQQHYEKLNTTRASALRPVLDALRTRFPLESAADVGCGMGYFSALLRQAGLRVTGFDGRAENIEECRRRHPDVSFHPGNIEDREVAAKTFDLVLCFGLLYHLENPFRGIRNLAELTGRVLLLESMCIPSAAPVMDLRDEFRGEDQGLNYVAFYPSEACLIKMMYRSGFSHVYRFAVMPDHDDFRQTLTSHRARTMLVSAREAVPSPLLVLVPEPGNSTNPWSMPHPRLAKVARRVSRLLGKLAANGRRSPVQQGGDR